MASHFRARIIAAGAIALALGAAACGSSGGSSSTGSASKKVQTVNLLFDFTPSPYEAPITWGEAHGIFAKYGIKLNIETAQGSSISVPEIASNKVAFGFGSYDVYIGDYLKGETGSTAIEVYENIPTTGIIAPKVITNLHQLIGKSFGDVSGSSGIPLLDYVLKKDGISPSEVPLKLLSFSVLYPSFYQGTIYSAEMDEPGDEDALAGAAAAHVPAAYTPLSNFGLTGYSAVLLASNAEIKKDPTLVKDMATAIYESEVQAVAKGTDNDIVSDFQTLAPTKTAADILPAWHDFKKEVTGFGKFDPKVVQSILSRVKVEDSISTSTPASSLYTNKYLPSNAG